MLLAHRNAHRRIWTVLALVVPALMLLALAWPQPQPGAPVQLAPAGARP